MSIQNIQILSAVLIFTLLQGCFSGQKDASNPAKEVKPGEITHSVTCLADTLQKYSLFIPAAYKSDTRWPLIICFDSHADGLLPVNLFMDEASKTGFIIAGSNNSKNGMPMDETTAIFMKILADIKERLNIDEASVYAIGFSGGSRVAGAAAITEGTIAGVVGCGAGLPNINQQPRSPFSYLAVAGTQDFNYTEMRQLNNALEKAGFVHHFLDFEGIHQWPPKQVVPDIFTWLTFDRMRKGTKPADRNIINSFIDLKSKKAEQLGKIGDKYAQQQVYVMMRDYLQGLTDIAPLDGEIANLDKDTAVIRLKAAQEALFQKESSLQSSYSGELQKKDVKWWLNEAAKLHSLGGRKPPNDETSMYKRVLGYLSLNSYMLSNSALKQDDLTNASKFIEIYRLVDPSNSEHCYMAATVCIKQGKPDEAVENLYKAVVLGFKDFTRLKSDPAFQSIHSNQRFDSLVKGH